MSDGTAKVQRGRGYRPRAAGVAVGISSILRRSSSPCTFLRMSIPGASSLLAHPDKSPQPAKVGAASLYDLGPIRYAGGISAAWPRRANGQLPARQDTITLGAPQKEDGMDRGSNSQVPKPEACRVPVVRAGGYFAGRHAGCRNGRRCGAGGPATSPVVHQHRRPHRSRPGGGLFGRFQVAVHRRFGQGGPRVAADRSPGGCGQPPRPSRGRPARSRRHAGPGHRSPLGRGADAPLEHRPRTAGEHLRDALVPRPARWPWAATAPGARWGTSSSWTPPTGAVAGVREGHRETVMSLAYCGADTLASMDRSGRLLLWPDGGGKPRTLCRADAEVHGPAVARRSLRVCGCGRSRRGIVRCRAGL